MARLQDENRLPHGRPPQAFCPNVIPSGPPLAPRHRPAIFGLSTTPVADTKSELEKEIDRNMMAILYRPGSR